jgi:hypothetical protein
MGRIAALSKHGGHDGRAGAAVQILWRVSLSDIGITICDIQYDLSVAGVAMAMRMGYPGLTNDRFTDWRAGKKIGLIWFNLVKVFQGGQKGRRLAGDKVRRIRRWEQACPMAQKTSARSDAAEWTVFVQHTASGHY